MRYGRSDISKADDVSFASIVTILMKEAQPLTRELNKREFTADDLAQTTRLLARFELKHTRQRLDTVAGATDRKTLIALLRRNTNLIKEMRVQLKPYQSSPAKYAVWLRSRGYIKLIVLGGGGPKDGPAAQPAA